MIIVGLAGCLLLCVSRYFCGGQEINSSTLRFVHALWRHGDRTPSRVTFPTDTGNGLETWPQGWGELTMEGMKQHYALGAYLRKRYVDSGFLSKDYDANEIYIRSTSYNRTIMSALANLAGMFPPQNASTWMDNIKWQPIPVHSVPRENDPMLWTDMPCPTANETYFEDVLKSEAVQRLEKENEAFLEYLRNASGAPLPTLEDWWLIFDPLNCEWKHNDTHKWPSWVTHEVFDNISRLYDISSTFYFHDFRLQRLRGGLLFGDIASRMEAKAKNTSDFPEALKYYVYSAHDTTMVASLENLGAYNGRMPEYATAILFELHETSPGQHIVKVFYLNETGSVTPFPLVVNSCGASETRPYCDLDAFVALARSHAPNDWYAECGIVSADAKRSKQLTMAVIALGSMNGLLLAIVLILLWKIRRDAAQAKRGILVNSYADEESDGDIDT